MGDDCSGRTASLSVEDFQRLQEQLVQLRESNCQYEERCSKLTREVENLRLDNAGGDQERTNSISKFGSVNAQHFLNSFAGKLRNTHSVDQADSDDTLRKLALQEEEFRLQNDTLQQELQRVIAENTVLHDQVKMLGSSSESTENDPTQSDAIELNNLKLQNTQLNDRIAVLQEQVRSVELARGEANDAVRKSSTAIRQAESQIDTLRKDLEETKGLLEISDDRYYKYVKQYEKDVTEVQAEVQPLRDSLAKAELKASKFEKRCSEIAIENDQKFSEYRKSLDEVTAKKDAEIAAMLVEQSKVQESASSIDNERKEWLEERQQLELASNELKADRSTLHDQNESLQLQVQETHSANDQLSEQLDDTKRDLADLQKQLAEVQQTADKRKTLLDEMAQHVEEVKAQSSKELASVRDTSQSTVDELRAELEHEKNRATALESAHSSVTDLQKQLRYTEVENKQLVTQLHDLEARMQETELGCQQQLVSANQDRQTALDEVANKHKEEIQAMEQRAQEARRDRDVCLESIARLKEEAKETLETAKVAEKKHGAMLKGYKREAQAEKRRADQLQRKLEETLKRAPGLAADDVTKARTSGGANLHQGDNGSEGSWIEVNGRGGSHASSPGVAAVREDDRMSTYSQPTTTDGTEDEDVVMRMAELQKEQFELRDKINMLEQSNAAMAEDLINKSAIIEQYVKEKSMNPQHHTNTHVPTQQQLQHGIKRVVDDVLRLADPASSDLRSMNRRLQLMLEESLTKNMHLERAMEILSDENQKLNNSR